MAQDRVHTLEFKLHQHRAIGLDNWTVRLGDKWAQRLAVGHLLYVREYPLRIRPYDYRQARIIEVWTGGLGAVQARMFRDYHWGSASLDTVQQELVAYYHRPVTVTDPVTAICYRLLD